MNTVPPRDVAPTPAAGLSNQSTAKGRLQRIALDALRRHQAAGELPTSIRFLFYELEQEGVLSKVQTGARRPAQDLTDAVMHLRQVGAVPWDWLVDDTRQLHAWEMAATVAAYVAESVEYARLDPWIGGSRPFLLCESRTIGGVFARGVAAEYLVAVAATNGQAGGFLVTTIAPTLRDPESRVLYVGDLDLAGDGIEENTRRVLERHTGRSFDGDTWERVAITQEQADGLRTRGITPILKQDRRYRDGHPHEAYEAEALGQSTVTALLRERLDALLPEPLTSVLERQRAQRAAVREALAGLVA